MAALKKSKIKFDNIIGKLDVHYDKCKDIIPDDKSSYCVHTIKNRKEDIVPLIESIEDLAIEIQSSLPEDGDEHKNIKMKLNNFQERRIELLSLFDKLLIANEPPVVLDFEHSPPQSVHSSNSNCNNYTKYRLPEIQLKIFDGTVDNWAEFRDSFISMIHENPEIDNAHKFRYLKSALQGQAQKVIYGLESSGDNYSVAWSLLEERYENKQMIITHHLKRLTETSLVKGDTANGLRNYIDDITKHVRALNRLVKEEQLYDTLIVFLTVNRLDIDSQRQFHKFAAVKSEPVEFKELMSFLSRRALLLDNLNTKPRQPIKVQAKQSLIATKDNTCSICRREGHFAFKCQDILKLSIPERKKLIASKKLCFNCLRSGHRVSECKSKYSCFSCKEKHNTILHSVDSGEALQPSLSATSLLTGRLGIRKTMLATVVVQIPNNEGKLVLARGLLDSGSESSFITQALAKRLKLPTQNANVSVIGLSASNTNVTKQITIKVQSVHSNYSKELRCYILNKITDNVPSCDTEQINLDLPNNVNLADPNYYKSSKIDILLGADIFWTLLAIGRTSLGNGLPTIQKTALGWILIPNTFNPNRNTLRCFVAQNRDIQSQLQTFWELETITEKPILSEEEIACEKYFTDTTTRESSGTFNVLIPFKEPVNKLGESKNLAMKRFINLETKLNRNSELKRLYHDFMQTYINLNHMTVNPDQNLTKDSYFLPHHGVLKTSSTTTKLRVVFDGSMPSSTGVSVNQLQAVGPTIQPDLHTILIRFRLFPYVVMSDIAMMYRMIKVNESQRNLQQILWRFNASEPILAYRLNTVTYGMAASAYLAIRSLSQLGYDNKLIQPVASKAILEDFYVDDLITGSDTVESLVKKCKAIDSILKSGGFTLRKWVSNEPKVIEQMQIVNESHTSVTLGDTNATRTLGIQWHPSSDCISYTIDTTTVAAVATKRNILSFISSIFDPLGLLAPCIIVFKILIQSLWLKNLTWDEPISADISIEWQDSIKDLNLLNAVQIPRFSSLMNNVSFQLHGFSDASEKAFGCVVYIRAVDCYANVNVSLLCAKSKVAPLKTITIPRLELCAAQLLTKLSTKLISIINRDIDKIVLWSDSTIVLSWLNLSPNTLSTFVSNRVSSIQRAMHPSCEWRHVDTKSNPADYISRGTTPQSLINNKVWWSGPHWLSETEEHWPTNEFTIQNLPERRKCKIVSNFAKIDTDIFNRYSSFRTLKRVNAYCLRFINNCRKHNTKLIGELSLNELEHSVQVLLKMSQQQSFKQDIKMLLNEKSVSPSSSLLALNPFLDESGLMRVGGRLRNSDFDYDKKHPVLLSADHELTMLIMRHEHQRMCHVGPQALLYSIRERYWPIKGLYLAKKIVRECIICFKIKPTLMKPIMGDLPADRLKFEFPFKTTGIDYAGPMLIKNKTGRGSILIKSYVALFICFATRAVHLELVTELTTQGFLSAFKRFTSRRGIPTAVYSDNGTNFVGANNMLLKFLKDKDEKTKIAKAMTEFNVSWKFSPARSPHHGGVWEANVKSMKTHLKKVLGNTNLAYEDMYTVLVQIESVLNSRPIHSMSNDPSDLTPLSPGHYLVGRSLTAIPAFDPDHVNQNKLPRFFVIQQIMQHFWIRWKRDYINQLQQRNKWRTSVGDQPAVGQLVLIKDDSAPPLQWSLGRITYLSTDANNDHRVAEVKTAQGTLKRSVRNLALLPSQ